MRNDEAPPAVRIAAANVILDRGYGKPKETVDANVRTSWEDLVLASMGRRREQPTQSSPPFIDVTPTEQKSEEMGEAELSRSPCSLSDLTAVAGVR